MASSSPTGSSVRSLRIERWQAGHAPRTVRDDVVSEEPLELRVDTRSIAVVMRTPGHDEELAVGFFVSEGLIRHRDQLAEVRANARNPAGNVFDVFLQPDVAVDFTRLTRHVFAGSSCGLCGKTSISAVKAQFPKLRQRFRVPADLLTELPARMVAAQATFSRTGGLHAAALFQVAGELVALREDVGRHNAVDKLLGRAFLDDQLPLAGHILLVSGRTSFEILQKALAGGIAFVAAVGAPSSLAVEFARANGQTLVGFLRDGRFNVYAGAARITRHSLKRAD
jgi:FdhD protein